MNTIWKDKILRFYLILFLLGAFTQSVIGALGGISNWRDVNATGWIIIVCSILGNCATTIIAFLNKNAAKLEQGLLPTYSQETETTTVTKTKDSNDPIENGK